MCPILALGQEIELNFIVVWPDIDMQCEVVVLIIFAEHGETILDDEVVGGFLGDAELEHVSVFLAGHPCLVDHHGHPHRVLAFLLLLFLPLVLGQSLDVDIV